MKKNMIDFLLPIETDRLIIRKTSIDDIDLIMKMDKQEITQRFLGGIKNKTREERISFLERNNCSLTVCLKDNTPIGFIGLKVDDNKNEGELSYIFDYDYCNKGYCTECCKSLIEIGFNELNLDKIYADTVKGNSSSIRVLEKLNFKYMGNRKEDNIEFLDYCILKKDYNNKTI